MISHLLCKRYALALAFSILGVFLFLAAGCQSGNTVSPGEVIRIQSGRLTDIGGSTVLYSRKFNFYIENLPEGWSVTREANDSSDVLDMEFSSSLQNLRAALQILPMSSEMDWQAQFTETRTLVEEASGSIIDSSANGPGNLVWKGYQSRANGKLRLHYSLYRHGVAYDLELWQTTASTDSDTALAISQADALIGSFNLINPTSFVYSGQRTEGILHDSPIYGYRIVGNADDGVIEAGLHQTMRETSRLVDFSMFSSEGFFFAVVPLWMDDLSPTPDALAASMGALFGASNADFVHRGRNGAFPSGLLYRELQREIPMGSEGKIGMQVLRVTQFDSHAYLLVAIIPPGYPTGIVERIRSLMNGFETRSVHSAFSEGPSQSTQERKESAVVFNNLGLYYIAQGELARAEPFIAHAWELEGETTTLLQNYADCLIGQEKFSAAEELLLMERHLLSNPELQSRLAFAQYRLGKNEEALASYSKAVSDGLMEEGPLVSYGYLLIEQGETDRARRLLTPIAKYLSSDHLKIVIAKSYAADGNHSITERELLSLRKNMAQTPEIAWQLFQLYLEQSRPEAILPLVEDLRDEINSPYLDFYAGIASYQLQDFKAATAYFNKAAEANLNDPEMRRWIELSDAAIGRNSATLFAKNPIDAVPSPLAIEKVIEKSPPDDYLTQFGAWHSYTGDAIFYEPGKPLRHTYYYHSHAHTAAGVSILNEIHIPFTPLYDDVYVNTLRVYGPDGQLVTDGDVSGAYLMDDTTTDLITLSKLLVIPIRGLEPGGSFELVVTIQSINTPREMPFKHVELNGSLPRMLSFVRFEGATDSILFADSEGVDEGKLHRVITPTSVEWTISDPLVYQYGRFLPDDYTVYPAVWIGARSTDWESLGKDYLTRVAEFLDPDPQAARVAEELTADLTDPQDIIDALMRHVQDTYAYRGVLFGVRAQIPNSVASILNSKSGDCKDLSVLMYQLLRARGIEAHLVLVNTRGWLFDQMPTLDQFDHMIIHVPSLLPQPFLDPTDRQLPIGLVSPHLSGLRALVLKEDEPFIAEIPALGPEEHSIAIMRDLRLSANGSVQVKETVTFSGYAGAALRYFLRNANPKDYYLAIRHTLNGRRPDLSFQNLIISNLNQRDLPLQLTYEYPLPRFYLSTSEHSRMAMVPPSWETLAIAVETEDIPRQVPYQIHSPVSVRVTNRYDLPNGWEIQAPQRIQPDSRFLDFSVNWELEDNRQVEKIIMNVRPTTIPAKDGAAFLQSLMDAERAFQPILTIDTN